MISEFRVTGYVTTGLGIIVAMFGIVLHAAEYFHLQACSRSRLPCPDYFGAMSRDLTIVVVGLVVAASGIVIFSIAKRYQKREVERGKSIAEAKTKGLSNASEKC